MSIVMQINPFDFFVDTAGDALDAGYVWIGEANKDPRNFPVIVYYDEALTIPAPMPLRTTNGYIYRNGSPTFLYINGNYSVMVLQKTGTMTYYVPDFLLIGNSAALPESFRTDLANEIDPLNGASLVGYKGRTLSEKIFEVAVSPMDFGAVGDGVADDTAEIQAALDASLNVSLGDSSRVYKISAALVPRDNQRISGNGATINHSVQQTPMFDCANKTGVTIDGGVFVGIKESPYTNSPASQAICITCSGSAKLTVKNNRFIDWCYAPVMSNLPSTNLVYINNDIVGPGATVLNNINFRNTTGGTLIGVNILCSGNRVTQTAQGFIIGQGSENVVVSSNIIHDLINEHGMYVDTGVKNVTVSGNTIRNTGTAGVGIKVQHYDSFGIVPEGVTITGNTINNTGSDGILLINTDGPTASIFGDSYSITGNSMTNIGQHGIDIRNMRNCAVSGNTVDICVQHGVYISKCSVLSVSGNTVRNCNLSGIFDDGTSGDVLLANNLLNNTGFAGVDAAGTSSGICIYAESEHTIMNNVVRGNTTTMQYALFLSGAAQSTTEVRGNSLTGARDVGARFATGGTELRYFGENVLRGAIANNIGINVPEVNQRGSEEWNFFSTAVPSTGTWPQGAKVYNRYPAPAGNIGWVCVVGGTPGTWKTFGTVAA